MARREQLWFRGPPASVSFRPRTARQGRSCCPQGNDESTELHRTTTARGYRPDPTSLSEPSPKPLPLALPRGQCADGSPACLGFPSSSSAGRSRPEPVQ